MHPSFGTGVEMTTQAIALNSGYVNHKSLRFSRTQMEAGIAHLPWDKRLKPPRPLSYHMALGVGVASTIAVACLLI